MSPSREGGSAKRPSFVKFFKIPLHFLQGVQAKGKDDVLILSGRSLLMMRKKLSFINFQN